MSSFRKTKRKGRNNVRQRTTVDSDEEDEDKETSDLLQEARKRTKGGGAENSASTTSGKSGVQYAAVSSSSTSQQAALVTSIAEQHPEKKKHDDDTTTTTDGIFRDPARNKFLAGPMKAATNIRTTARFDYQQDVCKDYKETGFCGYGDTCIYLHDRGDTLTGWQLEQQWETAQAKKKQQQEKEMMNFTGNNKESEEKSIATTEDGIPFACHICRQPFTDPVVTNCHHYFCESCIMNHVRTESERCPICGKDTNSVFNLPTKLVAKRRRILGIQAANADDAWEQYAGALSSKKEE